MKKLGTALFIGAAMAGFVGVGAGFATANVPVTAAEPVVDVGEPDPNGTGSASALADVLKALISGSSQATPAD
ncbi:hypothetical protein HLB23_32775 [Nocardia uniformis]|uniref:Uncharacterized protein n=1 Tax=Nocardia uniformis TaxID=53432 RepID=A0A849CG02_9NOCA|nr:hypothetical protein [Nocardia uniformis]NNH74569.1 hypothetical protein [Nocardia uniformis]